MNAFVALSASAAERLACYGAASFSIGPVMVEPAPAPGARPARRTGRQPGSSGPPTGSSSAAQEGPGPGPSVPLRIDPSVALQVPAGTWIRFTGHLDDRGGRRVHPRVARHRCRRRRRRRPGAVVPPAAGVHGLDDDARHRRRRRARSRTGARPLLPDPAASPRRRQDGAMRYGIVITTGDPRTAADLAADAEAAGWDGVFTYDAIAIGDGGDVGPVGPPRRDGDAHRAGPPRRARVRPRATPPVEARPRDRRPSTTSRAGGSSSRSASGRSTTPASATWASRRMPRTRARLLDETLAIVDGLSSGEPFAFDGEHYRFGPMTFRPAARPAAAGPGLGRGRVAARAVDAPGDPLGRHRGPGARGRTGRPRPGPRSSRTIVAWVRRERASGRARRPVRDRRRRHDAGRRPAARPRWSRPPTRRPARPGGRRRTGATRRSSALRARIAAGPPRA